MNLDDQYIDLHIHSRVSDGTWTSQEIASVIEKSGVGIYSITDHDDIRGVLDGEKYAKENHLNYIRGVEISSTVNGNWEHILAYGIDVHNKQLNQLLNENLEKLKKKKISKVKYLEDIGYDITYQEFCDYKNNRSRGGFKLLNYLIDKGICKDIKDFFNMFSDIPQLSIFPKYRSIAEVAEIIKNAGGVPVLAHPFYNTEENIKVEKRLKEFLEFGVEGIECYHPSHNKKISKQCTNFCKKNNLIMTVGSDCHGAFVPSRKINMHSIKVSDIEIGRLREFIL